MSKATYWQRGESIDYKNDTETMIEANEIITFGKRIGVAGTNIEPAAIGALMMTGVYKLPKKLEDTFALGDVVYWDDTEKEATSTATGGIIAGYAVAEAKATESIVVVKLLG